MKWTIALPLLLTADSAYASQRLDRKLQSAEAEYWFPTDITRGICSNDSSKRPSEFNQVGYHVFETLKQCCDFWYSWQKGENCYQNKEISATASSGGDTINTETAATPVTTTEATSAAEEAPAPAPALPSFFYPLDLSIGACSNDSSNRPSSFDSLGFTLFLTAEQCCDTWFGWQPNNKCLLNTLVDDQSVDDTGSSESSNTSGSSPGTSPTTSGESGSKFYLVSDVCIDSADGKILGGRSYATQLECCKNIGNFDSRKDCCYAIGELTAADQLKCLLEDPVEVEEEQEQFYLVNGACYSNSDGVMDGKLYATKEGCCKNIANLEDRHKCLWGDLVNGEGPVPAPGEAIAAPNSASRLAEGTFLVAALACFQFM